MKSTTTKPKVLVVDDEPSILASIADLLEGEFDVITDVDPQRALERLASEDVSVLVSDQRMPAMNGDKFLHFAQGKSSATRILLTGFADIEALARAVNEGRIYSYVNKPWDPLALRTIVRNAAREYALTRKLRYERDLLRTLVDNISDCVYVQDAAQRYTLVNNAFARLAGLDTPLAAIGKTEVECLPGEFGRAAATDGRQVLETGQPVISKCEEWKKEGTDSRWYSTTLMPIHGPVEGQIEGLAGISLDITRHKEIERNLKAAKETAEATVRAKQEFLALTSHEIRTPLNSILGMADLLSDTELTEQQRRFVDVFRANGRTLLRFVGDLTDLSHGDFSELKLKSAEFNPFEATEAVIELHRKDATAAGIDLVFEFEDKIPKVLMGDAERLGQILGNLVSNALKFTSQGTVVVRVKSTLIESEGAQLEFTVEDTGIGIAADKLDAIFEPFNQAEDFSARRYGGTGLGLTICRQLARRMGGSISVESSPGAGSVFRFTASFPLGSGRETNNATSGDNRIEQDSFAGRRVLVVDDNADGVMLLKAYLRSAHLEVAGNGTEAVDKFMAGKFDIVLMDQQMPEMDGLEATRRIREWESVNKMSATPILACTAHASAEDSLKAGCSGHLTKPILRKVLFEAMAKHIPLPSATK